MDSNELFDAYRRRPTPEGLLDLLRDRQHLVYRLCYRILRHEQDAEDAAQQVLFQLVEGVGRVSDAAHLRRWIHQVSFHVALNLKRARRRRMDREQTRTSDSSPALTEEQRDALMEAVGRLEPDLQSAVVDHYFEHRPMEQIAREQGCSTAAIWKRLEKAKELLRAAMTGTVGALTVVALERNLEAQSPVPPSRDLLTPDVERRAREAVPRGRPLPGPAFRVGVVAVATLLVLVALRRPAPEPMRLSPVTLAAAPAAQPVPQAAAARPAEPAPAVDASLPQGAVARLGGTAMRHALHVSAVAFSPDGARLASCGGRECCVWDPVTGRELRRLTADARAVETVAFSPDGKWMATGGNDQIIRLWPATGEPRLLRGHAHHVFGLAFSPDGATLASASSDSTLRLWDVAAGRELRVLKGHADVVFWIAFSPDGKRLASRSQDGSVRVWNALTGESTGSFPAEDRSTHPLPVIFSPDGAAVVLQNGRQIRFLDPDSGRDVRPAVDEPRAVRAMAYSPRGDLLGWGAIDGTITLRDVASGTLRTIPTGGALHSLAFSPDGRVLAAGGDRAVTLWETATGNALNASLGHVEEILALAVSPDGTRAASVARDGRLILWDLARLLPVREAPVTLSPRGMTATALLAFSPDGATLTVVEQGRGRILGCPTLDAIEERVFVDMGGVDGGLSADGRRLVSGLAPPLRQIPAIALVELPSMKEIRRWDIERSVTRGFEQRHHLRRAALSPGGSIVALAFEPPHDVVNEQPVGKPGYIRVMEASTGREVARLEGHTLWVEPLAFSPDGKRLASGGGDRTIRVWDVATGRTLRVLKGHELAVRQLIWSPDGKILASAGYDNRVVVWDAETGAALRTSTAPALLATALAFSPDGRSFLSGMSDGSLLVWSVP